MILENDLKIHVFLGLGAVESAVVSAVAAVVASAMTLAVDSRFKDPALGYSSRCIHMYQMLLFLFFDLIQQKLLVSLGFFT